MKPLQHQGAIPKENGISPRLQISNPIANEITNQINEGVRIMVIMRGAPGSGKTHLAKAIVERTVPHLNQHDFILSSDDFFYDHLGRYKYNIDRLDDAHVFNQRRVYEKAVAGWSPIIVDNTNMKLWEMMPYVKIAVQNGYIVELLQPINSWSFSAAKLALKNQHRVQRDKIQIMLNKFEKGNTNDLLKMLKQTKYSVTLPQMRLHPPIQVPNQNMKIDEELKNLQIQSEDKHIFKSMPLSGLDPSSPNHMSNIIATSSPKKQQERKRLKNSPELHKPKEDESTIILEATNIWKPPELDYYSPEPATVTATTTALEKGSSLPEDKTLLDLLKEGVNTMQPNEMLLNDESLIKKKCKLKRHSVDCPNELPAFASLRQIYPNKQVSGLWDLFVKCNGDIDWTVDILLKEDDLWSGDDKLFYNNEDDLFECGCQISKKTVENRTSPPLVEVQTFMPPKQKRPRHVRPKLRANCELMDVQETIANRIVFGEEHYSNHVRKLRDLRAGNVEKILTSVESQTESVDDDQEDVDTEIIELSLGEDLVEQLMNTFKSETALSESLPEKLPINVFIPRTLAKELFMLLVESVSNQIEEQRQQTLCEDEHFARLLKHPKYENFEHSPNNVQELLDGELAWTIYNKENKDNSEESSAQPTDLATHITQIKLCEAFPNIPRETLLDIMDAHGGRFSETLEMLRSMETDNQPTDTDQEEQLQKNVVSENDSLLSPHQETNDIFSTHSSDSNVSADQTVKAILHPDEMKRLALTDFEETRNMATHHSQLKAECYQKAKRAIQKGNCAVAVYYSQIANLHKNKIDMFNHKAANCIMDVHKYTQNNPDLLDLHYLYVMEAVSCLDIFLDRHITVLRNVTRSYKHIFIITGRGLHSAGGVSTIKNKVKTRLKERNLRWTEVNPGLLKVKIFSASRHSKNI